MSLLGRFGEIQRQAERAGRTLRSALTQGQATLVYHLEYAAPENAVIDPQRAQHILSYLRREGCLAQKQLRVPESVGLPQLALVHDYAYLEAVGEPALMERIFGEQVLGLDYERIIASQRRMVGGTVLAARMAVEPSHRGRPVVNLGGGLHHAHVNRGGGFCLFNDVAVAVRVLRAQGWAGRVLVVDLDLHQGDGTRAIFSADESVFTFSMHASDWEETQAVADLNVALGPGVGDAGFLEALREQLPRAIREARPDLVFYVAGVDIAADDQIGAWRVSSDGILARDRLVMDRLGDRGIVWLLSGGYGADAWRHSARSLAWLLAGLDRKIPSKTERDLRHFRRIASQFTRGELSSGGDDDDMIIRPEDLFMDLAGSGARRKFLGFYSVFGLELAFERYGALPKIREAGFPDVSFELQTDHPVGERLRIVTKDDRRDVLLELVLRENLSVTPYRMLSVEWLLLQNPRRAASPLRPLLPGQQHPGLGILREVVGMVVMMCERLGFDGLLFCPAHYHVAAQAHGMLTFIDPREEARYSAIGEAITGLSLSQATQVVQGGGLEDARTGEVVRWHAVPMVFPVSEACKAQFGSDAYDQAVHDAARDLRFQRRGQARGQFRDQDRTSWYQAPIAYLQRE
ncbi:MAG: histone deacetylase [Polyangia bacterium]|jgi:acetoin utilization deacetylase AcuC-like enzyme|nr:histone deacetylase [Polyangia bacterium]